MQPGSKPPLPLFYAPAGYRCCWRTGLIAALTTLTLAALAEADSLPADAPYVESNGRLEGEAEHFHDRTQYEANGQVSEWQLRTFDPEDPSSIEHPQGDQYLQALPDLGRNLAWGSGPAVDYYLDISTAGTYTLEMRWSGLGSAADSIYAGFFQVSEDDSLIPLVWYRDAAHPHGNFDQIGWDGVGRLEASGDFVPMRVTFEETGSYILRIAMREDGAAFDAWRLDLEALFPVVRDDRFELRKGDEARLFVLGNDTGDFDATRVEIVSPPSHGELTVFPNGSIHYLHDGLTLTDDQFTYRVWHPFSQAYAGPATVDLHLTSEARIESNYVQLPDHPPPSTYSLVEAFPGISFNSPHAFSTVPNDSEKLFVAEGDGYVQFIPDIGALEPEKVTYLDISDRVLNDGNEVAMKGVAAHPMYADNGYIYVTYMTGSDPNTPPYRSRLSRFTRDPSDPLRADPASELILLDLETEGRGHGIDLCKFGPDGYLYVGLGYDGSQYDLFDNSQRIDKDIWSTIIRIDVDKRPANLEPNAHPGIPLNPVTGLAYFSVPADNPFVGTTQFNGQSVDPAKVRSEMYVVGLRNPWQFDFVPGSEDLIVADVGRFQWEEISILPKGGNGGWAWREGDEPGVRSGDTINGAVEADAELIDPILAYSHDVGSSITGGLVYQGNRYPDLTGKYVFADYVSGGIWALDPTSPAPEPEFLTGEGAIVGFILDPSNDDILLLDRGLVGGTPGIGRILRLRFGSVENSFPASLSETNFFADLATLTPNPGALPYTLNLRFWSDYADKSRWFLLPDATSTFGYARDEPWTFPEGTVWAKHFDLELERGNPDTARRIETRFLVHSADGVYGVSYIWNEAQTEAYLAPDSGQNIDFTVTDDGIERIQTWRVPSRTECLTCHNEPAGHALSFNTRQLNRDGTLEGGSGNFIALLRDYGYLDGLDEAPANLPRHPRPDETNYSLESRVRAYLAVNCAYCHQSGGTAPVSWDGSPELTLSETSMVNGTTIDSPADPSHRLLVPGDKNKSVIWNRLAEANGYARMPPLASNEIDEEAADLLAAWIESQLPDRLDYDAWRLAHFGNDTDPGGAPDQNGDFDALDNHGEFLWHTDPHAFDVPPMPTLSAENGVVTLPRPGLLGRTVWIETSADLGKTDPWHRWDAPGNEPVPLPAGTQIDVSGILDEDERFFRYGVSEQ